MRKDQGELKLALLKKKRDLAQVCLSSAKLDSRTEDYESAQELIAALLQKISLSQLAVDGVGISHDKRPSTIHCKPGLGQSEGLP